jgi:hypothetical protein
MEVDQTLRRRTLGQRCRYWLDQCDGTLPDRYRERLVDIRNDATHTKRSVSRTQANDAITVAAEIVAAADSPDLGPLFEEEAAPEGEVLHPSPGQRKPC